MNDHKPGDGVTDVWEQRPDESDPAWQAFRLYRDLPAERRSLTTVARELSKSRTLISRWAQKYAWQLRVQAYERHLDAEWRAALITERRRRDQRNLRISDAMIAKVVQGLNSIDADRLTARDLASMFDLAVKVQRLVTGEPTSIEGTAPTPAAAWDQLTPEERRARLRVLLREGERRLASMPGTPRQDERHATSPDR